MIRIVKPAQAYYWATHSGAELDLFFLHRGRRYGMEFKYSEAPRISKSMRMALDTLKLDRLWIIYPGKHCFALEERLTAWPLQDFPAQWNSSERTTIESHSLPIP